jgi:uracil-DNA glycosylase
MKNLLQEIRGCKICSAYLPLGPRPIVQAGKKSRIVIIGQAPGSKVHASGIPWDDASGNELRRWLGVAPDEFYDPELFALVPMGFCYPGKGKSGDMAPRPECAPQWHNRLLEKMKDESMTLLIGRYSQKYYLGSSSEDSLTDTVKNYRAFLPRFWPLVHPSPRNRIWMKKNSWFEKETVPALQNLVKKILNKSI